MNTHVLSVAIIWIFLNVVGVYAQTSRRKHEPQTRYLYQVTMRDKQSGEKRFGFIDKTGKLVIGFDRLPRTTIAVGDFHEGRARIYLGQAGDDQSRVGQNDAVGFIDESGTVIIAARLEAARDFSEGLAYVEAKDFKGFVDRSGKIVLKLNYQFVKDFHEGLAAVGMNEMGAHHHDWGYIDRSGQLVIKQQFSFADEFSEGLAGVEVNAKYGFINRRGEMVIPPRFGLRKEYPHTGRTMSSGRFSEGLAAVRLGQSYGYINLKGDFDLPPQFSNAQDLSEGLAWVTTNSNNGAVNKVGWIDKLGHWAVTEIDGRTLSPALPEFFNYANPYQDWKYYDGLVSFFIYSSKGVLRGYMNRRGGVVIEPREFETAGRFVGGVASVVFYGSGFVENYGYINKKGQVIWRSK